MDPRLRPLVTTLAMTTLVAYLATFASHAADYLWPSAAVPLLGAGEGFDHIWTSASVLVGSVVAISLGQPVDTARTDRSWLEDNLIIFYAWGWFVVGVAACLIWAMASATDTVPDLIKNAATAFIGLIIPVVSSLFRDQSQDGGKGSTSIPTGASSIEDPIAAELEHGDHRHGDGVVDLLALDLAEPAKSAAESLKAQFPSVVFTSGRRSVAEQADAMAGNILKNRRWIEQTYARSAERDALQKWVDDNPGATTKAAISAGLVAIMNGWTDKQRDKLSKHFSGLAFDVRPAGDDLKQAILKLPDVKFLDNEGGLTIWHAQFPPK